MKFISWFLDWSCTIWILRNINLVETEWRTTSLITRIWVGTFSSWSIILYENCVSRIGQKDICNFTICVSRYREFCYSIIIHHDRIIIHYNLQQFVTICNFSDSRIVRSTRVYANSCYYDGNKVTGMRQKQVDAWFSILHFSHSEYIHIFCIIFKYLKTHAWIYCKFYCRYCEYTYSYIISKFSKFSYHYMMTIIFQFSISRYREIHLIRKFQFYWSLSKLFFFCWQEIPSRQIRGINRKLIDQKFFQFLM